MRCHSNIDKKKKDDRSKHNRNTLTKQAGYE